YVGGRDAGLVADGGDVAEADAARPAVTEDLHQEAAAVGDDGDVARPHGGEAAARERGAAGGERGHSEAVGAGPEGVALPRKGLELGLERAAVVVGLGEAAARQHHDARTTIGAGADGRDAVVAADGDDRGVDLGGQAGGVRVGAEPVHLLAAGVHGVVG